MSSPQLSALGAQQVLAALYQLSDETLHDECVALESDLKSWLANHFELSPAQESYLAKIDESTAESLSDKLTYFLLGRFPIQLIIPTPHSNCAKHPYPPDIRAEKLLMATETSTMTYLPGGGFAETASLLITIPV
jgi:hypothetical protein